MSATERPGLSLFVASFLSLYWEMAFIRWVPSAVHVMGFFSNLVLLACFAGLGVGMARPGHWKGLVGRCMVRLNVLMGTLIILMLLKIQATVPTDSLHLNEVSASHIRTQLPVYLIVSVVYALVMWVFIPMGELVGQHFGSLPPLSAYGVNIGGSLLGVAVFTGLSFLGTGPALWVAVGALGLLWLGREGRYVALWIVLPFVVAGAYWFDGRQNHWQNLWTPYYNLKLLQREADASGQDPGFAALVGNFFLLSGAPIAEDPSQEVYQVYSLPFQYAAAHRVLVLGAGGGNDVAMALSLGVEHVDAVEIDPTVLDLGRRLNPEHPYSDPRVQCYNEDARTFLRNTHEQYDLIIFGTLDSHGLFSALSSVKMENFVYSREAFAQVSRHLTPQGVVSVTVGFNEDWVPLRIYRTLKDVFGGPVFLHRGVKSLVTVLAGPGLVGLSPVTTPSYPPADDSALQTRLAELAPLMPTDDWPYLFLYRNTVPSAYLGLGAVLLLLTAIPFLRMIRVGAAPPGSSLTFFFLGAGFLLLETRTITEMALAFGSTWITSSVVVSAIMLLILLGTWLQKRFGFQSPLPWYGLLVASLVVTWWLPHGGLGEQEGVWLAALALLSFGVPVLAAAVIFAMSFVRASDIHMALAFNLVGAAVGGLSEYASMTWGFAALSLLAAAYYGLAAVSTCGQGKAVDAR